MTPAAKLAAAIDVFDTLEKERRPAGDVLKAWGVAHRFAGSGDRAGIAGLVYDALRRKASSAFLMGADTPRAILIGMLKRERDLDTEAIAKLADGSPYGAAVLTDDERARLDANDMNAAPPHVIGDYPDWLDPYFERAFGKDRAEEGAALASMLDDLKPTRGRWSPVALRIALNADAKSPAIHAEPAFLKGLIEVQDEGSQLAALFAGAKPGEQVVDLCAGAGGKTLALAALMENKGQIFATDDDKRRLAPIHDRLARSGARNVQVRTPKSIHDEIDDLKGRCDLVLIDAPCTGTGSWRRNPDAKWRMRPGALEQRVKEQADILDRAVGLLKSGGRIAYITCSVLDEENGAQVRAFLGRQAEFSVVKPTEVIKALGERAAMFGKAARLSAEGILMTPRTTGTDGFFVSVLQRA